ncbi:MAG: nitroreductase family deazaflavin-dependent oxidoreductase [Anaerolineae bacterium]|nr:nitroreductase family deazaflavin-dependent oxidoreductase [Anaerolineae bacterium]
MITLDSTSSSVPVFTLPAPNALQRALYRLPLLGYRLGLGGLMERFRIGVLTTRGRSSGLPRYVALEYRQHGSKVYIISGWGEHVNWVRNIERDPRVTLLRGARVQGGQAFIVRDSSEVFRALTLFYRTNPAYYERLFKLAGQRDKLDALTLPQIAGRVLVVRINPEAGEPALPSAPVDTRGPGLLIAGLLLALTVLTLIVLAFRVSRR